MENIIVKPRLHSFIYQSLDKPEAATGGVL